MSATPGTGTSASSCAGPLHLQSRADTGRAAGHQAQALLGPVGSSGCLIPVGDVNHHVGHAQHAPVMVIQPVERCCPGALMLGVGGSTAHHLVVPHGDAGRQHPSHRALRGHERRIGQDLAKSAADMVGLGTPCNAARAGLTATYRRSVSRTDSSIGAWVTSRVDKARLRSTRRTHCGSVGGQPQRVVVTEAVRQPHVAELDHPGTAILVKPGCSAACCPGPRLGGPGRSGRRPLLTMGRPPPAGA